MFLWYGHRIGRRRGYPTCKKRTTGRQVYRENVQVDSVTEYYKRALTIPSLDQLLMQIQSRFLEGNIDVLDAMYAMPNYVVSDPNW